MKLTSLYVVGGQQRSLRPLHAGTKKWYKYQKGIVMQVKLPGREVTPVHEYVSPEHLCAADEPAILFKSGTLQGDLLYLCTQTEILTYRLPEFEQLHHISLPQFHDVHHVRPTPSGTMLVVNTGLDMVVEITAEGEVVREWSTADEQPWTRFSRSVDYRRVPTTKPYRAHPNHVFCLGEEIWVTRFEERDALCLSDPSKRIHINLERVHDGIEHGGRLYFTTVDGKIVVVDPTTLAVVEVFDLHHMHPAGDLLGWCRGLYVENDRIWVGFSRLRPTKFRENISWVSKRFRTILPTRVACYDLAKRTCLASIDLEPFGLNAVFSVLPHFETAVVGDVPENVVAVDTSQVSTFGNSVTVPGSHSSVRS